MTQEEILDKNREKITEIRRFAENAAHFVEMACHNSDRSYWKDPDNWDFEVAWHLEEAAKKAREIEKELRASDNGV